MLLPNTLWENENERQKTEQVPISLPRAAESCFEAKKMKKKIASLDFGNNPIRFENHMDGPRYLKFILGYPIKYLSIWYFISHDCFTARRM